MRNALWRAGLGSLWILLVSLLLIAAAVTAWTAVWRRPATTTPSAAQVQALLPAGGALHSLVRVDLDGRLPLEAAALALIPQFPGATRLTYYEFIFAYDPWRREFRRAYTEPMPAPIPLSVDAGRLLAARDAAIFSALRDDGSLAYRVVGRTQGRFRIVHQGTVVGTLRVDEPVLVEEGTVRRAWIWDGRVFRERIAPTPVRLLPGIAWRFSLRGGAIIASADVLHLRPRQTVRLVQSGGGPTPSIIPDLRLDIVEQGYRARTPGTYTIRILLPGAADEQGFTLRLVVE